MKQFFLLCIGISVCLSGQTQDYFQQETNYRIEVELDDRSHTLKAKLELEYVNHSPDELSFIWFHLWPNAYSNQTTAFAHQQARIAGTEFYFAKDKQLGYIDSLQFTVDGQVARLEYNEQHPDLAKLYLPQVLKTGERIKITTPFFVKIPASFSRLGHVGESYQITQWYPKPAVYDQSGWHPMPYLHQGEFYAEFGSFEVQITLPANYVVGATGNLQTKSEQEFLSHKVKETDDYLKTLVARPNKDYVFEEFPASSPNTKTLLFTADKVHDFAWFADKRFKVQYDEVALSNGQKVDTWALFTKTEEQLWRKAISYLKRSLLFYSERLGDYPYPQMTAVQSALSGGGGMEYPMVTLIDMAGNGPYLDEVITHEVGHNWFYGILASNERDHPWLDEGLNSYYEQRYMRKFYPPARLQVIPDFLVDEEDVDLTELTYLRKSRRRLDQAPDTPSDEFSATNNYWLGAYDKPAKAFRYLEQFLGKEKFDAALQAYYQEWRFKHPQPDNLQYSLEQHTGENLDWLFSGLLYSNGQMDYGLADVRREGHQWTIAVENHGEIVAPVLLCAWKDKSVVYEQWIEGFEGVKEISLPIEVYDKFTLDHAHQTFDINRKNNQIKTTGSFKKLAPFRLAPLGKIENEQYTSLFYLPMLGWNAYDGLQGGLLIHNKTLPRKQVEFDLMPLYGFKSKSLNGIGNIDYHLYPKSGFFRHLNIGLNYRQFHFNREDEGIYDLRYQRWQPKLIADIRQAPKSTFSHQLQYQLILLSTEHPFIGREEGFMGLGQDQTSIHELSYNGKNDRQLNPFNYKLAIEQQAYTDFFGLKQNYIKWSLDWENKFYYQAEKAISTRLFVGGFLTNTRRNGGAIFPGAFSLIDQAATDYRYDDFYFGRSERTGFLSQQLNQRDGGFKVPINPAFNLGRSNNFILAINLKADLPFGSHALPIRPYFDIGYFDNAMPTGQSDTFSDQLLWSGGLALDILKGRFGVYIPLINSKNIQDRLIEQGGFGKRISFRFDLYGKKVREIWEAL